MYLMRVRSLRSILLVLLAVAWVPLTSHCKWEGITDLELFHCAAEAPSATGGGEPCEQDTCCAVEFAQYASPRPQDILPAFVAIPPTTFATELEPNRPTEVNLGILTAGPPGLAASWQFHFRTALPARAPSIAS